MGRNTENENNQIALDTNDSILIAVQQVEMIEFLKNFEECENASEAA